MAIARHALPSLLCPRSCDHSCQTEELWSCETGNLARSRASATQAVEQSSGELASAHATAGEENAPFQISPHRRSAFFLLIASISGHFQPRRHRLSAGEYRAIFQCRFEVCNEVTRVKQAAETQRFSRLSLSTSAFPRYHSSIYVIPNQQVDNTSPNGSEKPRISTNGSIPSHQNGTYGLSGQVLLL